MDSSNEKQHPDWRPVPVLRVVDHSSQPDPEKARPEKKLRFENERHSFESVVSDFNNSVYDEPAGVKAKPSTSIWSLGILDMPTVSHVPGTTHLSDDRCKWDESHGVSPSAFSSRLPPFHAYPRSALATPGTPRPPYKKRTSAGKIFIVPQPDDSANDPLNWSRWRRDLSLLSIAIFSSFAGSMTSVFAGGLGNIPQTHGRHTVSSFQLALTTVTFMIGLALGHIFQTPSAVKVGKRLVYLYSAFLFIASALLCAFTKSLAAILVGRALMGIALSPMEVLIPATLAELFPLHKRGKVLGLYLSFFLGSINLVPSLSALIVSHIYWRWLFLITAVAAAVPFLLIFFFVPESYWNRSSRFLHSKECVESWTKPDSDQTIVCKCLGVSTVRGRGRAAMYDGHSAPVANPRIVAQRERVLGKLHIRSQNQDDNHLKVSDALKSPAVVSATFQNVELSPAEAEIALARDAFDEPGQVPLRRRSAGAPQSPIDSRVDRSRPQSVKLRPAYLRFIPGNTWSPTGATRGQTASPGVSPTTKTTPFSHLSTEMPHGRSSLSRELPSNNYGTLSPGQAALESERRKANRPALRLDLNSVIFDREAAGGTPTPWRRSQSHPATPDPPTSLPVTPTPTANRFAHGNSSDGKAQETMAKNSSNNKNPGETFSLYTERLRVQGRQSWASSLKIWHGRLVSDRWSRIFLRPFRLIAECPTLLWAALLYAINVGLLAVLPRIVFLLFSGPWSVDHTTDEETQPWSGGRPSHSPRIDWNYQLDPLQVGGLSLATLLGVLVGALFAGWISDLVAVRMARRNDGVFEPEFRLLLVLPASCLAIAGALGFGFTLDKGAHVYLAGLCLLLIGAGCAAGTLVAVGYVVDCLTAEVAEAMVVLGLFKTLCHGIVFAILIDRWVCARGPKEVFIVIAGLHGLALLLTVPAYVFGKRARARGVRRNT